MCGVKSTFNKTLYQKMLNDADIIYIEESDNPSNEKLNKAFLST